MGDEALTRLCRCADPVVRGRAQLVRDALALGPTRAARLHEVSRRTASGWLGRYRAGGAARLEAEDPARRRARTELRRAILTAPLWMPTTKWSSRTVATTLGVSQSVVARAWTEGRTGAPPAGRLSGHDLVPAGLLVTGGYCALALRPVRDAPASPPMSARTRRRLRSVLAADLVRDRLDATGDGTADGFWRRVGPPAGLVVVTSAAAPVPAAAEQVSCEDGGWQALLPWLAGVPDRLWAQPAADLEAELRRWHGGAPEPFSWVAPAGSAPARTRPSAARPRRRVSPERALADEIVATIRAGVLEGRFASGDTVTERDLAGRLRTTRGQVRAALRLLESDGLVTATTGHGAVVPVPTIADAIETYAARRALGALMVRAATRWSAAGRQAVLDVLAQIEDCAEREDIDLANRLDMTFQNTLADASGLTRIAPMVQLLSEQVLMFIAVIGIDYAFPIEPILRRDSEIVAAIDDGDGDLAVERWRAKLDEALTYMVDQIGSARHLAPRGRAGTSG
jgi:DNA-binding GntR family transcriptional regulator